jgi:hypothetical protein
MYLEQHHLQLIRMGHKSSGHKRQLWYQSSHEQCGFLVLLNCGHFFPNPARMPKILPLGIGYRILSYCCAPGTFHLSELANLS